MRNHVLAAVVLLGLVAVISQPAAASGGSSDLNWKVAPLITATIIPNYQSGYGPSGGLGSNQTVAVGSGASLQGGYVDFGNVVAGYQYLYKYAAQVNVTSNDANGFTVYAEGATDFAGSSSTLPIAQTLFWIPTNSANSSTSPATPFEKTSSAVTGSGSSTAITYAGAPPSSAQVWLYSQAGSSSEGYDYELQLSDSAATSEFNAYIVYTVLAN